MIVGMDFGTTNSGMSFYDGQRLQLVPLDPASANPYVARSALYITNRRRVYMGRGAVEKYYEQNINRKVKYQRVWVGEITLEFAELPAWVRDVSVEKDVLSPGRLFLSFKTGLRSPSYLGTVVGAQYYLLEDIVALYLYVARLRAEDHFGTDLRRIVLGRPVRFSTDPQQDKLAAQRLVHAAFLAGYDEVYLQPEPIAAAYFYETSIERPENVLIFDFGGGTLDITIARLGDPQERHILATGGVPIAGDVFDQKLVRGLLPRHFGEGSHYRDDSGLRLPVPLNFYEAFADWQEMIELNRPEFLRMLEHITRGAERQRQLDMLRDLITSSYSLKMFDAVEAAKRELSRRVIALIGLDGPSFRVQQPVTRAEFERLIQEEVSHIAATLDEVIEQAGLAPDQIDAVIRTGGSAQIPAFIQLLEDRFGLDKVREIDTFSSVTSGLGILAHQVETGAVDLRAYHREGWTYGSTLRQAGKPGAPKVDLDLMKKFVDLEERHGEAPQDQVCLVVITPESDIRAATEPQSRFDGTPLALADLEVGALDDGLITVGAPEARVLLMTSEYRFLLRARQDLADLAAINLSLTEMEALVADRFGRETVCAVAGWDDLQAADQIALIASRGEAKVVAGDALRQHLDQLQPYRLERLSGEPAALIPADAGEIVLFTDAGSVARLDAGNLVPGTQRLMRLRKDEAITGVLGLDRPADVLLMDAHGRGKRLNTRALAFSSSFDLGIKVLARRDLCAAVTRQPGSLWAITTQRLVPLDFDAVPLDPPTPANSRALVRLNKNERVLALRYLQ
jgi:hypothetical chaperone protein